MVCFTGSVCVTGGVCDWWCVLLVVCVSYWWCVFDVQLLSKEHINGLAILCIGAAGITWGFALYFFFQHLTSWHVSIHGTPTPTHTRAHPCF